MLIDNQRFVIKNIELIENSLSPLVEYMAKPARIEFDEDLVSIVNNIIIENKKLTNIAYKLIPYIYGYEEKTGCLLLDL